MRIIAGKLKGRRLELPRGSNTRPTKDRVREAVFSALSAMIDFEQFYACDLYAGSGSYGLEALSRGCPGVVFCEQDRELCKILHARQEEWHLSEPYQVVCGAVRKSLSAVSSVLRSMDEGTFPHLIFVDPPYREHPGNELLSELITAKILVPGSVVVVESSANSSDEPLPPFAPNPPLSITEQKSKRYGDTAVTFYSFSL